MIQEDIISCVLDVNKIEPDSWENWWSYWNSNKKLISKIKSNHNSSGANWEGVDLYRSDLYNPEGDVFDFPLSDVSNLFPKMLSEIKELPVDISVIRAVKSLSNITPHRDCNFDALSLRVLLYDNNPNPNFFYITEDKKIKFQKLPSTSNTWIYDDSKCLHGTSFYKDRFKIILMVYGEFNNRLQDFLEKGILKYPEYIIKNSNNVSC